MEHKVVSRGSSTLLGMVLGVLGIALIAIALLADQLGLSNPNTVGVGQVVVLSAGIAAILLAGLVTFGDVRTILSAGRRFYRVGQTLSVVVLNTLLILGACEGATFFLNHRNRYVVDSKAYLPYYQTQDWASKYWQSHARAFEQTRYEPYVVWRTAPFSSETINIDARGIRKTPGAQCGPTSYQVFAFGGSTMLGFGSPDWGTIPAYLQEIIGRQTARPVCVTNFGDRGWVSTQSLVVLVQQLQAGHRPDLVIFYDGFNDASVAYETGAPGNHAGLQRIRMQLDHPVMSMLLNSNTATFVLPKLARLVARPDRNPGNHLANDVARTYVANYEAVEAMAVRYGFRYGLFVQPVITLGDKPLTTGEQQMVSEMEYAAAGFAAFLRQVYGLISAEASSSHPKLKLLIAAFDGQRSDIWIDWSHTTPEGNKIVAAAIADALQPDVMAGSQ